MKRILAIILAAMLVAGILGGCKQVVSSGTTSAVPKETEEASAAQEDTIDTTAKSTEPLLDINDIPEPDLSEISVDYQGAAPKEGEEVAILHTGMGDISIRFFPEVAPKAVYNFIALAKDGRYDEILFHRVTSIETAGCTVIQSGDYTNYNGTGGVSAYGDSFGYEVSDYVHNTPGSVAMAHSGMPDSNGSQFYINVLDNNNLDGQYTVFAQVYDGMDVVEQIAAVERDASDKPINDVILESVEIVNYSK